MVAKKDDNKVSDDDLKKMVEDALSESDKKEDDSEEISDSQSSNDELKGQLARAMADLQNFKRRSEEDQASFCRFANAEMLKKLLPIFDHLSLSVQHLPDDLADNEWAKGIVQINEDSLKTLETIGVKKIATVGEKLDPNLHEALISGPGEKDKIIEELEPGYTLNDAVVKPAKVKVGDGSKK